MREWGGIVESKLGRRRARERCKTYATTGHISAAIEADHGNRRPKQGRKGYLGDKIMAIIIVKDYEGEDEMAIGPFASGELASRYGFTNLVDYEWYWIPFNTPK